MRFVFSDPQQPSIIEGMCRWAGPRIGESFDPTRAAGISVLCEHGAATVLYTDYSRCDLRVHVAGVGNWVSRTALAVLFGYPFQELGVRRISAFIARKNKKSRRFCEKLGFTQEGCLRKAAENGDNYLIYGMLAEECRWLKENGNVIRRQA